MSGRATEMRPGEPVSVMTQLQELIESEIEAAGAISFARFMQLALYHPSHGYYEKHARQTGRQGDFFTSVSVGSLYGEFLGFEFARRLQQLDSPNPILLEAGAHDGQLARDILAYLAEFQPSTYERTVYTILEPSPARARRQAETLGAFDGKVRWLPSWSELEDFSGICFSNELLDAMPVHVFRWNKSGQRWIEWGVARSPQGLNWSALPLPAANAEAQKLLTRLPASLAEVLPDLFTIEISPEAISWWLQASHALHSGWLFTADYGLLQEDFFAPHRSRGTLRTYSRHQVSSHLLDRAGDQDITAHVNFSLLIAAGESAGLATEQFTQQTNFLKGIVERIEADPIRFPLWTPMRYRQLASLIHPEHLGRAFKILVQRRL